MSHLARHIYTRSETDLGVGYLCFRKKNPEDVYCLTYHDFRQYELIYENIRQSLKDLISVHIFCDFWRILIFPSRHVVRTVQNFPKLDHNIVIMSTLPENLRKINSFYMNAFNFRKYSNCWLCQSFEWKFRFWFGLTSFCLKLFMKV